MKLAEIVDQLDLEIRTARGALGTEVTGGYASDLMSDVIAHAPRGYLWVTLQIHRNVVAVASLKELAGVLLVNGREPEEETLERAEAENIPLMVTPLSAFDVIGRLHLLGITGGSDRAEESGEEVRCEP